MLSSILERCLISWAKVKHHLALAQKNRRVRQAFASPPRMVIANFDISKSSSITLPHWNHKWTAASAICLLLTFFWIFWPNQSTTKPLQALVLPPKIIQKQAPPQTPPTIPASPAPKDTVLPTAVTPKYYPKAVLADKTQKKLYLLEKRKKWSIIATHSIARGRIDGNKEIEGDLKTPEGLYFVKSIDAGERFGPLYGALLFRLNYPNRHDRKAGKTGSGIWIHGVEFGNRPTFTRGCLSLSNQSVTTLIPHLRWGSPVFIAKTIDTTQIQNYFKEELLVKEFKTFQNRFPNKQTAENLETIFTQAKQFAQREKNAPPSERYVRAPVETYDDLEKALKEWAAAWSSRQIEQYSKYYHPEFIDKKGRTINPYLARKKLIFESKDSITVAVSKIEVQAKNDTLVRVSFFQDYSAFAGSKIQNWKHKKSLYFSYLNNQWLIHKE